MGHKMFDTRISGIPCICVVDHYDAGTNYYIHSASLEPNDPIEFEFHILDRRGYPAHWLESKITEDDEIRILEEYKGIEE